MKMPRHWWRDRKQRKEAKAEAELMAPDPCIIQRAEFPDQPRTRAGRRAIKRTWTEDEVAWVQYGPVCANSHEAVGIIFELAKRDENLPYETAYRMRKPDGSPFERDD